MNSKSNHVKMSPHSTFSKEHLYWADINSRLPVYVLLNISQTRAIKTTTDKAEAEKHGTYSSFPIGCYYHDETESE